MDQFFVMDVGGSHIKYALMTTNEIIEKGEVPTPADNSIHFVQTLVELAKKYENQVKGIALSVPGRIDTAKGLMHTGGYLSFIEDFPLVDILKQQIPLKITIENDGKCAALGERWKGALVGVENGMVVVLGTGIGGGILVNGKLMKGQNFGAGELSWLPISMVEMGKDEPFLWAHLCGTMGLTEVYERERNLPYRSMSGKDFFKLANAQDPSALKILDQFSKSFAIGVIGIQAVLDTEVIAIGGGISAQPLLIESLQKAVDDLFGQYESMPIGKPKIVRCAFANDANLYGALYHHLYE
jgi:predicted NBD/HSP70 family sugar kinase